METCEFLRLLPPEMITLVRRGATILLKNSTSQLYFNVYGSTKIYSSFKHLKMFNIVRNLVYFLRTIF